MASGVEADRFRIETRPDRDRVVVVVAGELDVANVSLVREALDELYAAGWRSVVLDLRELTLIDSTGLSLLVEMDRAARRTGIAFAIVDGSPAVARLLEVVGLQDHFRRAQVR